MTEFLNHWLLTILIFLPTAGAVLVMFARDRDTIRRTALAATIVTFALSLLLMYFLIGIWGGPRKEYAAIKFFLYTLVGSIGLLIVLIGTYLYTRGAPGYPHGTFDLVKLAGPEMQAYLGTKILLTGNVA